MPATRHQLVSLAFPAGRSIRAIMLRTNPLSGGLEMFHRAPDGELWWSALSDAPSADELKAARERVIGPIPRNKRMAWSHVDLDWLCKTRCEPRGTAAQYACIVSLERQPRFDFGATVIHLERPSADATDFIAAKKHWIARDRELTEDGHRDETLTINSEQVRAYLDVSDGAFGTYHRMSDAFEGLTTKTLTAGATPTTSRRRGVLFNPAAPLALY